MATAYNGVVKLGVAMLTIMETIGEHLNLPSKSLNGRAASDAVGFLTNIIDVDDPVSSEQTRRRLGWRSKQQGLIENLQQNYFSLVL